MSVAIKLNKESTAYGSLHVVSDADTLSGEDVVMRMRSIINVLKAVNLEAVESDDLYFVLSILEDYLPTPEQANKMVTVLTEK